MSLEGLSSGEYMRVKSSEIWERVAMVNPTLISIRPGRIKASSSFSGQLVVITRTLPSCEATQNNRNTCDLSQYRLSPWASIVDHKR